MKPLGAEFLGTFWLVLGGCGSAVVGSGAGLRSLWRSGRA
jgi:glycerol uptake facilitator-like aquaporin